MSKISAADLPLIEKALADGLDVRIQNTPDGGYRIVAERVKVLKRSDKHPKATGFSEKR